MSGCLMMDGDGKSLEYQDVDIFFQYVIHNIDYICMYNVYVYIYIYCMYVYKYIYIYTLYSTHIMLECVLKRVDMLVNRYARSPGRRSCKNDCEMVARISLFKRAG